MERFYLGISISHNSSACIYSNERGIIAAISQERLNGEKNTKEIPFEAALKCLELADTKEIEAIGISHYETISTKYFQKHCKNHKLEGETVGEYIFNFFVDNGINIKEGIYHCEHHLAHAYSTYGFYGKPIDNKHYLITSDGFGEGESGRIIFKDKTVSSIELKNSVGLVYQFVTGALGFTELKHEGKITGLAAFGKPIYLNDFESLYKLTLFGNGLEFNSEKYELTPEEKEAVSNSLIDDFDDYLKLKKAVYELVNKLLESGAKREDIAASVQEFVEIHTLNWIRYHCKSGYDAFIAGGLFANVKINQRIKDMKDIHGKSFFKNVYVCPAMGDEGTAVGSAIHAAKLLGDFKNGMNENASVHVISGTFVKNLTMDDIDIDKYIVHRPVDSIKYIAHVLTNNKIVCLMRGRMEFGPRALCHRSILYNADSRETNDWLNKKLSRTEFMPFAPVTREEVADDLFINLDGGRDSAKFMTMTFDCTEEFAENYKAACHIDNTARPQIISKSDDEYMWNILKHYQDLTGKKAMINTSFNLHNNPIIESVEVAIDSWIKSDTDVLVIGDYVIEKR